MYQRNVCGDNSFDIPGGCHGILGYVISPCAGSEVRLPVLSRSPAHGQPVFEYHSARQAAPSPPAAGTTTRAVGRSAAWTTLRIRRLRCWQPAVPLPKRCRNVAKVGVDRLEQSSLPFRWKRCRARPAVRPVATQSPGDRAEPASHGCRRPHDPDPPQFSTWPGQVAGQERLHTQPDALWP